MVPTPGTIGGAYFLSLRYVVFLVALLGSSQAHACSHCVASLVYQLFPFMREGMSILAAWRIGHLYFQRESIHKNPIRFVIRESSLLAFLYFTCSVAFFFVYLAGYFAVVLFGAIRSFTTGKFDRSRKLSLALQGIFALAILPIAFNAYVLLSSRDLLDRLRYYVFAGTGQSRALAIAIAEDDTLNLARLRRMMDSEDNQEVTKAFEVLYHRKKKSDVVVFKDYLLSVPETEYSMETCGDPRFTVYISLWLESITGRELKSKEELESWIANEESSSAQSTPDHPGA